MEVFRISSVKHSKKLAASGREGRWNKDNEFVLYTAQHRSLATLELVAHKNAVSTVLKYETMIISIADDEKLYTRYYIKDMPSDWQKTSSYSKLQAMGSNWYKNNRSLVLQIPSAIVPQEFNFIINTRHPDFSNKIISLARLENFFWDDRIIAS